MATTKAWFFLLAWLVSRCEILFVSCNAFLLNVREKESERGGGGGGEKRIEVFLFEPNLIDPRGG